MIGLRETIKKNSEVLADHEVTKIARAIEDLLPEPHDTVLIEAEELIHGERLKHYGHPKVNFQRIAGSWSEFLGMHITPVMVCVMMILLKSQRMAEGYHRDSIVDIGGYAALAAILEGDDEL